MVVFWGTLICILSRNCAQHVVLHGWVMPLSLKNLHGTIWSVLARGKCLNRQGASASNQIAIQIPTVMFLISKDTWHSSEMPVNADHFRSMPINSSQCRSINSAWSGIDQHSSALIGIDHHWDQCHNFDQHWALIGGFLISAVQVIPYI